MLSMRLMLNLRHAPSRRQPSKLQPHTKDCTDDSPANVDTLFEYLRCGAVLHIRHISVTLGPHMGLIVRVGYQKSCLLEYVVSFVNEYRIGG
ncbi:hypothetical protein D3C74_75200 [compost metagenome]